MPRPWLHFNRHDVKSVSPFLNRSDFTNAGERGVAYFHWCPGCKQLHAIYTINPGGRPQWSFNGDVNMPSFSPSILCFTTEDDNKRETLCHYFIKTGAELIQRDPTLDKTKSYIDFCGDSPHEFGGKVVPLPELPDEWKRAGS